MSLSWVSAEQFAAIHIGQRDSRLEESTSWRDKGGVNCNVSTLVLSCCSSLPVSVFVCSEIYLMSFRCHPQTLLSGGITMSRNEFEVSTQHRTCLGQLGQERCAYCPGKTKACSHFTTTIVNNIHPEFRLSMSIEVPPTENVWFDFHNETLSITTNLRLLHIYILVMIG